MFERVRTRTKAFERVRTRSNTFEFAFLFIDHPICGSSHVLSADALVRALTVVGCEETNLAVIYFSILVLFYFSFVLLLRLVDGRLRAHRPTTSFSFVHCVWSMGACGPIDQTLRFRQGSVNCVRTFSWGAAAPQTPRDDGLNLARPTAKIWGVGENLGRWRKSRPSAKISAVGENLGRRRKSRPWGTYA